MSVPNAVPVVEPHDQHVMILLTATDLARLDAARAPMGIPRSTFVRGLLRRSLAELEALPAPHGRAL